VNTKLKYFVAADNDSFNEVIKRGHPTVDDVYQYILTRSFPHPQITLDKSGTTCPYIALGTASEALKDVPYYMAQDTSLTSSMYADLQSRVLQGHTLDSLAFAYAESNYQQLKRENIRIEYESSVWTLTDQRFRICMYLLSALGVSCVSSSEDEEKSIGVKMDRFYSRSEDKNANGLVAWEDKSPLVFQKHCTTENIIALCGPIRVGTATEKGFRAMVFKVSPAEILTTPSNLCLARLFHDRT
jgi:hypothetical protein